MLRGGVPISSAFVAKGMQRQSEISSSSRSKTQYKPKGSSSSTTQHQRQQQQQKQQQQQQQQKLPSTTPNKNSARASSPKQQQQQQQHQSPRTPVKILKSKKPLTHFKFYLDICDHQQAKKIEDKIKQLGGTLEFFLTPSVTHFITDKSVLPPTVNNNNNTLSSRPGTPQTPCTPATPQTPYSLESPVESVKNNAATPSGSRRAPSIRQSRADAILNRARRGSVAPIASLKPTKDLTPTTQAQKVSPKFDSNNATKKPYIVWQTEQAQRFFAKVQNDLKDVLAGGAAARERKSHHHHHHSSKSSRAFGPTHLKGSYIKIESLKRNYRPYYQLFKKPAEWPKIELTREDGAFRLSPKKELENSADNKKMTRKSRSRSSQRQQQQPPLPAAVQALKKTTADSLKSSGQKGPASNANTCKQAAKETSEKQCGVCEICKIEYDTLTIHLKTKDHEYFAKNSQNFIALDTLIHSSADVNKFLEDEQRQEMELEEMEVEEQDANAETIAAHDPLEDSVDLQLNKRYNSDNTPSPTLREKSKRVTKGKHSSEKFQHASSTRSRSSKSPKSLQITTTQPATKSSSPKKPASTTLKLVVVGNDDRMGTRNKTASAANAAAAGSTVYSPPLRAMLPPSSMYKVVDATPADVSTPLRKTQVGAGANAVQAVNSPSLIVKFKKVREAELCRLSGEADRFMFRKQRTSSELPTDVDRQTTSDHLRTNNSSTSLDDSSAHDATTSLVEMAACEKTETKAKNTGCQKKAIAIGKRRKGATTITSAPPASTTESRRFPTAPIQPEIQLKHASLARNRTAAAPSRRVSLPEATRKSSRTATAIVTAATTSSRLLRAAVEAAKKAAGNEPTHKAAPAESTTVEVPVKITRSSRLPVVKVEDRMGDAIQNDDNNDDDGNGYRNCAIKARAQRELLSLGLGIADDDEDDDEITEDDADNDEDFIVSTKLPKVTSDRRTLNELSTRHTTREERAARRWTQRLESLVVDVEDDTEAALPSYGKRRKLSQTTPSKKQAAKSNETVTTPQSNSHIKKVVLSSPPQRYFDIMKSERLSKLRYAFERLPVTDLWYRVYARQDACEERYFEYYGSNQYRKLPYEMGPIPFDFTLNGPAAKCCTLCQMAGCVPKPESDKAATNEVSVKKEIEPQQNSKSVIQTETGTETKAPTDPTTTTTSTTTASSYTHKHKKLHLLQRYHQELLQEQQKQAENQVTASTSVVSKCDSKASTPEREAADREREREREQRIVRAGSTHSNTSSCTVSSTGTLNSQHKYRNKHLNKANLLNLELPPRKSPREHASTLALVSCIIRQRQDSLSKPNSETDEPALSQMPASPLQTTTTSTTTAPLPSIEDDVKSIKAALKQNKTPKKSDETLDKAPTTPELRSTRSAAATPIEELRFATEISETVKRMRRGQNKYDHSPPIVLKTRPTRGKSKVSLTTSPPLDRRSFNARSARNTPQTPTRNSDIVATSQRRRPRSLLQTSAPTIGGGVANTSGSMRRRVFGGRSTKALKSQPSIRKTGSKKGVLEFEVDTAALKALKAAMAPQISPRQLEWEIEKYLELAANDFDCEDLTEMLLKTADTEVIKKEVNTATSTAKARKSSAKPSKAAAATTTANYGDINTPPPTDCFSSDFDLYDLITNHEQISKLSGSQDEIAKNSKSSNFSLYSSVALQNYFRKRKPVKSNRTGWPKAQKKKSSLRHQHLLRQKDSYLPNGAQTNGPTTTLTNIKAEIIDEVASTQEVPSTNGDQRTSSPENVENDGDGVITPPDSEVEDNATVLTNGDEYENDDEAEFLDAIDDTAVNGLDGDLDGETIADSIEIERCCTADLEADAAAEADIEAEDEEANEDDDDDDDDDDVGFEDDTTTMYMEQRCSKRLTLRRRSTEVISPIVLKRSSSMLGDGNAATGTASLTSTPTTTTAATPTTTMAGTANMLRGLRRTPVLLNGSLGSCISPSEKAGDNSDIFTVSSDGLDTDLDMSNSQTQIFDDSQPDNAHCPHVRTPKRKYDISKYAPNNKNARTCAAEAATAAVKSLAISQFLKKEVRVTCRRLRPPFRRFRFRR